MKRVHWKHGLPLLPAEVHSKADWQHDKRGISCQMVYNQTFMKQHFTLPSPFHPITAFSAMPSAEL